MGFDIERFVEAVNEGPAVLHLPRRAGGPAPLQSPCEHAFSSAPPASRPGSLPECTCPEDRQAFDVITAQVNDVTLARACQADG